METEQPKPTEVVANGDAKPALAEEPKQNGEAVSTTADPAPAVPTVTATPAAPSEDKRDQPATTEPVKPQEVAANGTGQPKADPAVGDDDDDVAVPEAKEEGADEEDALFTALEEQDQKEHEHDHQSKDLKAAPKMLQDAIKGGQVEMDDSESEEEKPAEKKEEDAAAAVKTEEVGDHHHVHARVSSKVRKHVIVLSLEYRIQIFSFVSNCSNILYFVPSQEKQLDFLLSKASEYSSFISRDLEELQAAMTESAKKKVERAEKRSKKRSRDSKGSSKSKKSKNNSGDALKTALVKDAQVRAGEKPIFVQPPNLADGCYLKDYQLEGVRWLASLFENGVSGILADEVR